MLGQGETVLRSATEVQHYEEVKNSTPMEQNFLHTYIQLHVSCTWLYCELLCCLFAAGENPESKENKHITRSLHLSDLMTFSTHLWLFPGVKKTKGQI